MINQALLMTNQGKLTILQRLLRYFKGIVTSTFKVSTGGCVT